MEWKLRPGLRKQSAIKRRTLPFAVLAKKMVPSDPSTNSFSDRHARSEHGIRIRCDVSPLLPAAGFARLRINALVRVRVLVYGSSPLFDAAFRSPAAMTSLAASLRSQVNVPGLHLQCDSAA